MVSRRAGLSAIAGHSCYLNEYDGEFVIRMLCRWIQLL